MIKTKTSQIFIFIILVSFLWIFYPSKLSAQLITNDFSERVESYQKQNPRELVYVQTDREIYAAGDQVSFKAYVRDLYKPGAPGTSDKIHIILASLSGDILQDNVFQIANNLSNGVFYLANGISEGEYLLAAWTSGMEDGPVDNIFRKKLFIKNRLIPGIFVNLSAGQTRYLPGDMSQIKVELASASGKKLKRKKISYVASFNGSPYETKDSKTDKEGKADLNIPIPDNSEPGLIIVEVAVENMGETSINSILIPTSKTPVWIDFSPEGGLLVNGTKSQIGFRAYDFMGNAVDIEGQIINMDGEPVEEFKTSGFGFGSFTVNADAAKPMKVRLTKPAGIDIDFPLPAIQERGIKLAIAEKNNDSINFIVNTDIEDAAIPLHAVAEINGNLQYEKRFNLKIQSEFSVPVKDLTQAGVLKVNLLSRTGEVLAHRSIFMPGQNPGIIRSTDPTNPLADDTALGFKIEDPYGKFEIPSLSISVTDNIMAPVWKPVQDIMSWFLLGETGSYAGFPVGFLCKPSPEEARIIDHFMLFQMDNDLDWEKIKSGKNPQENNELEFRDKLKQIVQAGDFELFISQTRQTQFFNRYFIDTKPGFMEFVGENKPELENLGYLPMRLSSNAQIQKQLASGQSIMSVLMSIKPYKLMGNNIVFRGNDSFNYQGGVLIVIDGVPRGTDPAVFNSISPHDVESITASSNISDIQKYSGLNSTGIIEIKTKTGQGKENIRTNEAINFPTIFWNPDLQSDHNGKINLTIPAKTIKSGNKLVLQGIDSRGNLYIWSDK